MKEMILEINRSHVKDETHVGQGVFIMGADAGESNWIARVCLSESQAVVAFPKFGTVGIGFQVEKADWNTNLPASCPASAIYEHIKDNLGDHSITRETCIQAIKILQPYAAMWLGRKIVDGRPVTATGEVMSEEDAS